MTSRTRGRPAPIFLAIENDGSGKIGRALLENGGRVRLTLEAGGALYDCDAVLSVVTTGTGRANVQVEQIRPMKRRGAA
jgi:hypothetical protein